MSDKKIKFDLISTEELCDLYVSIAKIFKNSYEDKIEQMGYNKDDVREMFYKSVIATIQTNVIFSHLLNEGYDSLSLLKSNSKDEKTKLLTVIFADLKGNLFFNIFLRFENFIRIIAENQGITDASINRLSKDLIRHLKLNNDYKKLIDIFTYIRNTMHTEGFHSNKDVSITYKDKTYNFKQNKPISFMDNDFITYLFTEVNQLVVDIIEANEIKSISNIPHNISGFIYEY